MSDTLTHVEKVKLAFTAMRTKVDALADFHAEHPRLTPEARVEADVLREAADVAREDYEAVRASHVLPERSRGRCFY
jgi:hypothetical protein